MVWWPSGSAPSGGLRQKTARQDALQPIVPVIGQTEKGAHHLGSFPVPYFVLQYSPPIQVGGHDPPLDKMRFSWHDLVSGKINEKQTDMHLDDARFVRWRRSAWLRRRIQS
jgi:hypothetical protein